MKKKYIITLTFALVFLGFSLPLSGSGGSELPPSLLGYLRVDNPDQMIGGFEEFLQGLEVPPLAAAALKMGLGVMIQNSSLTGVDLSGPFILASFQPDQADAWAISLSLSSPDSYRRTLSKNWQLKSSDEEMGIEVYHRETREFDRESFQAATPEERVDVDSFYRTGEETLAVVWKDKRAWISSQPAILKDVPPLAPSDFPAPVAGDLATGLQVQPLLEIAEESLRERMIPPPVAASPDASPFGLTAARAMSQAYLDFYLHYARQVENLFYGLTLDGSGVKLEEMVQACPGTGLAKFLAAQKKGKLSLARFLEPSPWLVAAGRIDEPEMMLDMYSRLFAIYDEMLAEMGETGADQEAAGQLAAVWRTYIPLLEDYLQRCIGDEMAFSISSSADNFISGVSLQKIRDREAYREYIKKSFLANRELMTPFYSELGIALDDSGIEKPEIFQGIEIYTVRMTFDFKKLSQEQTISEEQMKILALMESPLVIKFAASGDLVVTEIAWGGEPDLKARLEAIASKKSTFDTDQLGATWSEANGVVYFSLNRFLNDFLGPMIERSEVGEEEAEAAEIIQALGQLDLPLVSYLTVDGPTLKATVDIPMERIQAVKTAIESVQAKKGKAEEPKEK